MRRKKERFVQGPTRGKRGGDGWDAYIVSHDIGTVWRVEEMPVPEDRVPERSLRLVVDLVDVESAERRLVADVEKGVGRDAIGVVVCQAGEEERTPFCPPR